MSYFKRITFSPYLDRAGLKGKDQIVAQMADDFRIRAATAGSVTEDDLEGIGWTRAQIEMHGRAAAREAQRLAAR